MRLAVCGGRNYQNHEHVRRVLDEIVNHADVAVLITGGARGADFLAEQWAFANAIHVKAYQAEWTIHGRAAGPLRNQRIVDDGKPDFLVAFPGGRGTADMVRRAKAARIPVRDERDKA